MATKKESEDTKTSSALEEIAEKIESLSVLELSRLSKLLEEKFGVSAKDFAMPMMAAMPQGGGEAGGAAQEEKSVFNVVLKEAGGAKIQVIKVVKDITGKGLTEAKDLVEKTPATIKEGVKKEEAEELKKKIEAAGGVVTFT